MKRHKDECACFICQSLNRCELAQYELIHSFKSLVVDVKDEFCNDDDVDYISKFFKKSKNSLYKDIKKISKSFKKAKNFRINEEDVRINEEDVRINEEEVAK